jgi:hypothetical protein
MKSRHKSLLAGSMAALALAGCSSTNCDPARAGFLESIGCSSSGGFGARQASLEGSLAQQQAQELQQRALAEHNSQEATAAQADLAKRRRDLANLDNKLAILRQELTQAQHREGVDRSALNDAERQVTDLQVTRRQLIATDPDPQALQRLMAREDKLLEMLKSME